MTNTCQLSNNTKNYVEQYHCILENMIQKMSAVKLTESISGSFITQMIPHHCAAIAMSENLLRYTTNIPLQNIAMNIITSQQKSIENMTAAYPECQCTMNYPEELSCYEQNNYNTIQSMFYEMKAARTENSIDANFMREMIPHHKGAVYMSENALQFPVLPALVPLLEEIVRSQKEGIRKMRYLLQNEMKCR
ncbi:DUF305 domain-containing protein [uncultured Robinsoniella sp.]|uniref:DUF305 domain-containing protein n=1 Tax=uncultured Robinsoniella sp. TaxID=904190 RepID=UPI00374F403A